jgi:hypothetical protein
LKAELGLTTTFHTQNCVSWNTSVQDVLVIQQSVISLNPVAPFSN